MAISAESKHELADLRQEFSYGDHELQRLTVIHPFEHELKNPDGFWII